MKYTIFLRVCCCVISVSAVLIIEDVSAKTANNMENEFTGQRKNNQTEFFNHGANSNICTDSFSTVKEPNLCWATIINRAKTACLVLDSTK